MFEKAKQNSIFMKRTAAAAKWLQSCPTLCDPKDGSPPGSPVPRSLQARTLEWVAISFSNFWFRTRIKPLPAPTPSLLPSQQPWGAGKEGDGYRLDSHWLRGWWAGPKPKGQLSWRLRSTVGLQPCTAGLHLHPVLLLLLLWDSLNSKTPDFILHKVWGLSWEGSKAGSVWKHLQSLSVRLMLAIDWGFIWGCWHP